MVADKHVIEFMSDRREDQRREFQEKFHGQQVVRLDIYIGSPPRYPDIVAALRVLATQMETTRAIGRDSKLEDKHIVAIARSHCGEARQKLAEMYPTIKRAGVPNSKYRKKQ